MNDKPKSIWASKTIWGLIIAVLPLVGQLLGVEFAEAETQQLTEAFMTIAGIGLAAYGRAKAKQPIALKPPPEDAIMGMLAAAMLTSLIIQPGCKSADAQRLGAAAFEASAQILLSAAVAELGERSPELEPWLPFARNAIEMSFAAYDVPEKIGDAIAGWIATDIPDAEARDAITRTLRDALNPPGTTSAGPEADYYQRMAAAL